ncbi:SagB/ThcOx family dehydrogenase [Saccharopolyspora taberi]|uniref:SagB/ThcOx family dehydrogenase n=1 Tax=Saccharopolyspora taberi TaxID=60895 RepID=A0ABN3VDU2_9PSEU
MQPADLEPEGPVGSALRHRRTVRSFSAAPVPRALVMRLLWAAQGELDGGRRTTPSAGGRHPLAAGLIASTVDGVGPGVYRYRDHALETVVPGDHRRALAAAGIGAQPWLADAAAVIVLSGDVEGMRRHFADQPPGDRGVRYAWVEAGAAAQNVYLQAGECGLGVVLVGGFADEVVRGFVPAGHEPLVLVAVGNPVAPLEDAGGR